MMICRFLSQLIGGEPMKMTDNIFQPISEENILLGRKCICMHLEASVIRQNVNGVASHVFGDFVGL